jgi:hypothetical protein
VKNLKDSSADLVGDYFNFLRSLKSVSLLIFGCFVRGGLL